MSDPDHRPAKLVAAIIITMLAIWSGSARAETATVANLAPACSQLEQTKNLYAKMQSDYGTIEDAVGFRLELFNFIKQGYACEMIPEGTTVSVVSNGGYLNPLYYCVSYPGGPVLAECVWANIHAFVPPSKDKSNDGNKADEQQDNFGMTATDFLHAISKVLAKVRIGDQTSQTVEYGIGPCVVVDGEIDDHQFLYWVNVAPTADDHSGCDADDAETRNLVFVATAEVMKVLTGVPDIKQNGDTLLTLAQNLKEDPVVSGLRSSETKVGQRTVRMLATLGGSRIEYAIYPR